LIYVKDRIPVFRFVALEPPTQYRNALDRADGAPLWFVVAADRILLKARGLRQWEEVALPKIRSMVR
jgi:hypothetical protein